MAFPHSQHFLGVLKQEKQEEGEEEDINIDMDTGTPIRYVPLRHVYSATSPCVSASGSSNVMSKKVKARKLVPLDDLHQKPSLHKPPILHFYSRRPKKPRHSPEMPSFFNSLIARDESGSKRPIKVEHCESEQLERWDDCKIGRLLQKKKRRKIGNGELVKLGVDSSVLRSLDGPRLREVRKNYSNSGSSRARKRSSAQNLQKEVSGSASTKRWVGLSFDDVDPKTFNGLQCKVYWPLDDDWYSGSVVDYDSETNRHRVEYEDGDQEHLILSNEKIKFYVSHEDMQRLNLSCAVKSRDGGGLDYNEMVVLAASLDDCQDLEPGDIIWAKLTGHAMWPAIVLDESCIGDRKGLNRVLGGRSIPVQFFGTHDFARIKRKQAISFLGGLLSNFHLKCKKPQFVRSLEEAKVYLSEHKLPKRMLRLQNGIEADDYESASGEGEGSADSGEDCMGDERKQRTLRGLKASPYEVLVMLSMIL